MPERDNGEIDRAISAVQIEAMGSVDCRMLLYDGSAGRHSGGDTLST